LHIFGVDAPRSTRKRKLRSSVWKEFEPIYQGNLIVQAKCIHCLDILAANRENGRSACRRHLAVCKERLKMNQMVENLSIYALPPDARALKNWKFDLTYCQVPFNMAVNNYTIFILLVPLQPEKMCSLVGTNIIFLHHIDHI